MERNRGEISKKSQQGYKSFISYRRRDLTLFDGADVFLQAGIELLDIAGEFEREGVEHSLKTVAFKVVVVEEVGQCLSKLLDVGAKGILEGE